jgi:hypothetical protein
LAWVLIGTMGCTTAAAREARPPVAPVSQTRHPCPHAEAPHRETETAVPGAAKVALGIGAVGLVTGLVALPASETRSDGAPSSFALAAMGAGAASVVVGGVILLAAPRHAPVIAAVHVTPTGAAAVGSF